jgi:hypothetical protein
MPGAGIYGGADQDRFPRHWDARTFQHNDHENHGIPVLTEKVLGRRVINEISFCLRSKSQGRTRGNPYRMRKLPTVSIFYCSWRPRWLGHSQSTPPTRSPRQWFGLLHTRGVLSRSKMSSVYSHVVHCYYQRISFERLPRRNDGCASGARPAGSVRPSSGRSAGREPAGSCPGAGPARSGWRATFRTDPRRRQHTATAGIDGDLHLRACRIDRAHVIDGTAQDRPAQRLQTCGPYTGVIWSGAIAEREPPA